MVKDTLKSIVFYTIYKNFRLRKYNKINNVNIISNLASLKAHYGKFVRIDSNVIIADDVSIGDYSYVNRNSSIENCVIGKYCSISSGVYISPWEHQTKAFTTHPIGENKQRIRKQVVIGNDVLISLNAIILEGVKIGDGAVVGAGAVVSKDVDPFTVVGGVPAKRINQRFPEAIIKKILESEWWDLSQHELTDFRKDWEEMK